MALSFLLAAEAGCNSRSPEPAGGAGPHATSGPIWFKEVSKEAGVDFQYHSGHREKFYIPEIMGGGVGLLDYDGDGLLDIYCVQGGDVLAGPNQPGGNRLYHNLGDWKFEDVTAKAGVAGLGYGMGCACADYDGDGRPDIFVTAVGRSVLYHNNGDGTFTDVTEKAGVDNRAWGTSAAFFDYDGDGHLDLIIANYIQWSPDQEKECYSQGGLPDYCGPMSYHAPAMPRLYHNRGDGTFEDVTVRAGLNKIYGNGLGVVCADFDHDGWPDIYVANDAMPNQLWMNDGKGHFHDEAMARGCAVNSLGVAEAGMGVAVADLYDSGWPDLFITHLEGEANRLFVDRNGFFTDEVKPKGPGAISWPYTGFGVGLFDFNNDGAFDLYVANGKVKYGQTQFDPKDPYAEPSNLLRGLGNGEFEEIPNGGAAANLIAVSRAAAFGDLDNDGGIDVVVVNRDHPVHLLRNVVPGRGHWILFKAVNRRGSDAIGAQLRLAAGGRVRYGQVQPNQSYCASNDPRVHFGLGRATRVDSVRVRWPFGETEEFGPFAADQICVLRQGSGRKF